MGSTNKSIDQLLELFEIKLVDGKWRYKYNMDVLEESSKHPESVLAESRGFYKGPALFIYGTKSPFKVKNRHLIFPFNKLAGIDWSLLSSPLYTYTHYFSFISAKI